MARWDEFERLAPEIAAGGRKLIYQHGIGLGYLATVRKDGGPRLHPFCPIIAAGGLYGLFVPSPKRYDLARDGRSAIHAFPADEVDDEFYVAARAHPEPSATVREAVAEVYRASGGNTNDTEDLFEFDIERALLATYKFRGDWPPLYQKWAAAGG
ncbi:MAG: hypothetical protein ACRDG3_02680 [Tepidiformaceae bacterium]